MTIESARDFFMWCTIMNGGIMIFSFVICLVAAEPISRIHSRMFSVSKGTIHVVVYSFLLTYKLLFLVFNVIPWFALMLMG